MQLDTTTKQQLAEEVERLVRMGMERKVARSIVWQDYQDEQAAVSTPATRELETPIPEPPKPVTVAVTKPMQPLNKASFFTPERLEKNRAALAQVKRLLRSTT